MRGRVPLPQLEEVAVGKEFFGDAPKKEMVKERVLSSAPKARQLYRAVSVFPFQVFPDEIIADEFKVSIITRIFFFDAGLTRSVLYRDLSDVSVEKSLWFAALKFGERGFPTDQIKIEYLWRDQVEKARRLVEGMIVLDKERVDTTKLSLDDLFLRQRD